jgi:hypothetical protein
MIRPTCYNIPEGKSEQEALPDELLELLANVFQGVTNAFGDNATLYRLDIGRVYESVQSGDLVVAGQFVDRSDGEIFNFEINQGTNKVGYKSTGDFLNRNALSLFLGEETGSGDADDSNSESSESGPYPFDLLLQAINEESSEAYQSPFGSKLRKDLDYLGALSALMYHAGATIEAQPLYTGLHSYAIKYALRGLRLFSQSISSIQGRESADSWVDEHGLDFAAAVVKEFSSRRCVHFQESIQSEDQEGIQELKDLVDEAIGMAMATTTDLIKSVVEADDYQAGDVQATLAAAIEEYCPIDNSEGYNAVDNARQLSAEWQEVVSRSGCVEDLSMSAIGLPAAQIIPSEQSASHEQTTEPLQDSGPNEDTELAGERIFYVNVGEGPSRNWDDCRKFGFLAAGGGRKWSKQLEKIQIGDTVIAYLKGYGYVGIGRVTSTATPATKFTVNGELIKELPLINDTIRSIKRFSKENGEYLIGIDWQVAVPREQAAWRANAGLYTTPLVCSSLRNQAETVSFASNSLLATLNQAMENSQAVPDQGSNKQWRIFNQKLCGLLDSLSNTENTSCLRELVQDVYSSCPNHLDWNACAINVVEPIREYRNESIMQVIVELTELADDKSDGEDSQREGAGVVELLMFFAGIADLGDRTDDIYEKLLDLVDDDMNLSALATCFVPHNTFELTTMVGLLQWPELPDWARAHLVVRDNIGLSTSDRDAIIEYLGCFDNLGPDTLLAISRDMSSDHGKYSSSAAQALKAFLSSDFDAVVAFSGADPDDLQSHFDSLGNYYIEESKKILGVT